MLGPLTYGIFAQGEWAPSTLYSQNFDGTSVTPEPSITEFVEYSSNPIIDANITSPALNPKEPSAIKIGSTYYMVATTWSGYNPPSQSGRTIVLLKSANLTTWELVQTLRTSTHAANIFEWNGSYHIVYSGYSGSTNAVGYMHASDPEDTWTDEGIIITNAKDPTVFIEDGTVYLFACRSSQVHRWSTTEADFTEWSSATLALGLPPGIQNLEAPSIYKLDGTYYMYVAEMPQGPSSVSMHNAAVFTASSITGSWSRLTYALVKGAGATWHDDTFGNLTFIRSGDIETNPGPLQVGDNYPIFCEGADGSQWRIGLLYGRKHTERPAYTLVQGQIASIDVLTGRLWLENHLTSPSPDTLILTLPYSLPTGGTLWTIETTLRHGRWNLNSTNEGLGLLVYQNSTNWWIVRLSPRDDTVRVGRLVSGEFAWLSNWAYTTNPQIDYKLIVEKIASDQIRVSVDDSVLGTVTHTIIGTAAELAFHIFRATGDIDYVTVYPAS